MSFGISLNLSREREGNSVDSKKDHEIHESAIIQYPFHWYHFLPAIRKEVAQSVAKSPEPVPSNAGQVSALRVTGLGLSPAGSVLSTSQAPDFQSELRKEQASQEPQTFTGEKSQQVEAEGISKTFCHHCSGLQENLQGTTIVDLHMEVS